MPDRHSDAGLGPEPTLPFRETIELMLVEVSGTDVNLTPYEVVLSAEEKARADRFRFARGRNGFVLTRAHLKLRLSQYLGVQPEEIHFDTNASGKPRLRGQCENRGLVFNVSHSGDFALLAFARDTALGVDIEAPRHIKRLDSLARECLTLEERVRWQKLPEDRLLPEFLRLWTCKEAFFKATGRGIALGLQSVSVAENCREFEKIPDEYGAPEDWQLHTWQEGDYHAALAYSGNPRSIAISRTSRP